MLIVFFLNTPIRRLHDRSVTAKRPLLGVGKGFLGEAGVSVGEKNYILGPQSSIAKFIIVVAL